MRVSFGANPVSSTRCKPLGAAGAVAEAEAVPTVATSPHIRRCSHLLRESEALSRPAAPAGAAGGFRPLSAAFGRVE